MRKKRKRGLRKWGYIFYLAQFLGVAILSFPLLTFPIFLLLCFFPVSMSLVAICFPLSLVCACVDGNFVSAFVSAFSACDEGWVFFFSWMGGRGVTTGLDLA